MPPIPIYDPRLIPQSEHPFLVSAGSSTDPTAEVIEFWDKSKLDHSMFSLNKGTFTWQSMTSWYGEKPMDAYLKKGGVLKFYQLVQVTPEFKIALANYNLARASKPWWEHLYNWLGIVGQAIGLHWISFPGLFFCSQVVIDGCKKSCGSLPAESRSVILSAYANSNPAALDEFWMVNNQVFKLAYTWDSKTGIII
jgi:hypothetical protein